MALLAFVFAATWVVSTGMAAHLRRLLQAAGASASGAIAAAALVGPAQVTARLVDLPLALFGPAGYGLRTGVLSVPARVAQAGAPLLFGLLLDRVGLGVLLVSSGPGLASTAALLALQAPRTFVRGSASGFLHGRD